MMLKDGPLHGLVFKLSLVVLSNQLLLDLFMLPASNSLLIL